MSWQVMLLRVDKSVKSLSTEELPQDFSLSPIGSFGEILATMSSLFPNQVERDKAVVIVETEDYVLWSFLGDKEPIDGIVISVYGGGNFLEGIFRIAEAFQLRIWDIQTGEFIESLAEGDASFGVFIEWRNRVLGDSSD